MSSAQKEVADAVLAELRTALEAEVYQRDRVILAVSGCCVIDKGGMCPF